MQWLRNILSRLLPSSVPGAQAERVAARFLTKLGYRILAQNVRSGHGEIDLVAEAPDGRMIVIVEVKSHLPGTDAAGPRPEVRVDRNKQRKLAALASQFVRRHRLENRPVRFDVIGVDLVASGEPTIRHHPAAFESPW